MIKSYPKDLSLVHGGSTTVTAQWEADTIKLPYVHKNSKLEGLSKLLPAPQRRSHHVHPQRLASCCTKHRYDNTRLNLVRKVHKAGFTWLADWSARLF